MKAAEILRSLIDIIAREEERESRSSQQPVVININNGPGDKVSDETDVMIPPLQQKIELMKKSQGIDSVYDNDDEEPEPDELEIIKRSAGIQNMFDDDDEPFQG